MGPAPGATAPPLPKTVLGTTGIEVTRFGLGGEGVLRTYGREAAAVALIREALDRGVTYFESARAYAGSEDYYGAAFGARRREVFFATKSHARTAKEAARHLRESLERARTDWIDLWQMHDLRTGRDLEERFGPGGAMETFERARQEGSVRFLGITGHEDPAILERAMGMARFDSVLVPVNPAEPAHLPFSRSVIPRAAERGMWVVGMKTLARGMLPRLALGGAPDRFLRYALGTEGVDLIVVGCDGVEQLRENLRAVASGAPLSADERAALEDAVAPVARELLYYKP